MMRDRLTPTTVYLLIRALSAYGFMTWGLLTALYRFQTAGLTPLQLVLVGTVLEVAYGAFEVPTGIVADLYSRRLSVIIGYLLMGFGFFFEGLWPQFGTILLAQVIWGIGATFESGALDAWLADEIGEARLQPVLLQGSQVGRIAALLGIATATVIGRINIAAAMRTGGLVVMALGLILIVVMPENGFTPAPRAARQGWQALARTFRSGTAAVRANRILLLVMAITLFAGLASEARDRLWEAHLLANFRFPTPFGATLEPAVWFGLMAVVSLLLGLTVTEYIRRRVALDTQQQAIRAQVVLTLVEVGTMVVFALATGFGWALGALLAYEVAGGARYPVYSAWVNREIAPQVRATVLSMSGQFNALGQIAGGPLLGWVGTVLGLRWAMGGVAAFMVPIVLCYGLAARWTARRVVSAESAPV